MSAGPWSSSAWRCCRRRPRPRSPPSRRRSRPPSSPRCSSSRRRIRRLVIQVGFKTMYARRGSRIPSISVPDRAPTGSRRCARAWGRSSATPSSSSTAAACPRDRCPQRPAGRRAPRRLMGFAHVKVAAHFADSFGADWVNKGYPTQKGRSQAPLRGLASVVAALAAAWRSPPRAARRPRWATRAPVALGHAISLGRPTRPRKSYRGKVLPIDFWATRRGPCTRRRSPHFIEMQNK